MTGTEMQTKLNDAMFSEIKDWWEQKLKDYEPKDQNDLRLDAVAELMFLFSTQYLFLNDYSFDELKKDLKTQYRLYGDEEDD